MQKAARLFIFLFFTILIGVSSHAQHYQLAADSAITMTVTGTSTLHGWTVAVNEVKAVPQKLVVADGATKAIENFTFDAVISSMDGGRGASMNSKITNALKATEHPLITYTQNEPLVFSEMDDEGNFKSISTGTLKMVGMEKEISIEVMGQQSADGLLLKGTKPLKFSEFDIAPPSAMFGQIVCGDDIAVHFEFRYQRVSK